MTRYAAIDLTRLPLPDAIDALDYETILAELTTIMIDLMPEIEPVLGLESEPATKVLQVFAYRELILRAVGNDKVRAVNLATATGTGLDNLAALFGVERLVITPAQPLAVPPLPAVMESDDALRRRTQISLEGFTTAGSRGSYEFHARSADGRVRDVSVLSPTPGTVQVVVISHDNAGVASADLLGAVTNALNDDEVRPLTDTLVVQAGTMTDFAVDATIRLGAAPGAAEVLAAAEAAVVTYLDTAFRVGQIVRRSALLAALHRPGVDEVVLTGPAADVDPGDLGAARCTAVSIDYEVLA